MSKATESHLLLRRDRYTAWRAVLRILFLGSLFLAPVFVIFPMLSGLLLPAALVVILAGAMLVTISWRERRPTASGTTVNQEAAGVSAAAPPWSRRAAANEGWRILSFLAVLAVVLAGTLLDWRLLVIGTIGVFAAMALFGLPVWLAASADAAEDQADRGRPGLQP